jgi:hypothetical protein
MPAPASRGFLNPPLTADAKGADRRADKPAPLTARRRGQRTRLPGQLRPAALDNGRGYQQGMLLACQQPRLLQGRVSPARVGAVGTWRPAHAGPPSTAQRRRERLGPRRCAGARMRGGQQCVGRGQGWAEQDARRCADELCSDAASRDEDGRGPSAGQGGVDGKAHWVEHRVVCVLAPRRRGGGEG